MFSALEEELGEWQIVINVGDACDYVAFAMTVDPFWFKHVFPTARISMHSKCSTSADIAPDPQLSATKPFAFGAVNEKMGFASFKISR